MHQMRSFRTIRSVAGLSVLLAAGSQFAVAQGASDDKPVNLEAGDKAPVFEGVNDAGKKWKSGNVVGKKYLVVYFYPADFTTGCTRQAQVWRDNMNKVVKAGVEVVGVSGDSIKAHKLFKEAWKLNFTLLSDENAAIAKKFGVPVRRGGRVFPRGQDRKPLVDKDGKRIVLERKATFARWTYVIGRDGNILYKNTRVRPAQDSQNVLEFIQGLKGPKQEKTRTSKWRRSNDCFDTHLYESLTHAGHALTRDADCVDDNCCIERG